MRRLCETEGTTVFVSSHLLSEMELMCDSVAIIQNGRLVDVKQLKAVGDTALPVQETLFELDHPEAALKLIGRGVLKNGGISVEAEREEIAELNAQLVAAGFKIYSIRALSRSLEDQFLEITGGEGIE
ncbi:hypothetical protein D3C73_1068550 [compost metagenome]